MTNAQDHAAELHARLIHSYLRKHRVGVSKEDLCREIGMDSGAFNRAVRFSRRCEDTGVLANEIVAVTKAHPKLYFLAKTNVEATEYVDHRFAIIDGHLVSVDKLLTKQAMKWPEHAREIELVQVSVRRVMEDIQRLRMTVQS